MARHSRTGNVRKLCGCKGWKACAHPWYLDFRPARGRRVRRNLDELIGYHARDFDAAKREAERAKVAIRDNRDPKDLQPGDRPTLAQLLEEYQRRLGASLNDAAQIPAIVRTIVPAPAGAIAFGEWTATEITTSAIEAFRAQRPKVAGNRNLALLRAMFNWAVLRRLVDQSPFRVGHVAAVKLARETSRTRRLQPGEEERLLLAANSLRDLVIAALETGCRKGELLSLQWHQVRFFPRAELFLPAQKTKAKKDRRVPLSSALRTVLEGRRCDPAGEPLPADAYVFGDEIGRSRRSIKTAWRLACGRAKLVDLHFHDLRREAGSRWMDAGVPLATIQRWLGHHDISQTSTYLSASLGGDEQDMRAFEQRIGRVEPLPNVAQSAEPERTSATSTDAAMFENAEQNHTVH